MCIWRWGWMLTAWRWGLLIWLRTVTSEWIVWWARRDCCHWTISWSRVSRNIPASNIGVSIWNNWKKSSYKKSWPIPNIVILNWCYNIFASGNNIFIKLFESHFRHNIACALDRDNSISCFFECKRCQARSLGILSGLENFSSTTLNFRLGFFFFF